jgi:hypothetical protein
MQDRTCQFLRLSCGVGRWAIAILLGAAAFPAVAPAGTAPAALRQVVRPLPLEVIDLVWRADAREPGLRFRLYREEPSGRLSLLAEIPARLGAHDYRLADLPPAARQRYVLRLLDAAGHENLLRTIELVGFHQVDPPVPVSSFISAVPPSLPGSAAELPPPPPEEKIACLREERPAQSRAVAPPDQPPDRWSAGSASLPA